MLAADLALTPCGSLSLGCEAHQPAGAHLPSLEGPRLSSPPKLPVLVSARSDGCRLRSAAFANSAAALDIAALEGEPGIVTLGEPGIAALGDPGTAALGEPGSMNAGSAEMSTSAGGASCGEWPRPSAAWALGEALAPFTEGADAEDEAEDERVTSSIMEVDREGAASLGAPRAARRQAGA